LKALRETSSKIAAVVRVPSSLSEASVFERGKRKASKFHKGIRRAHSQRVSAAKVKAVTLRDLFVRDLTSDSSALLPLLLQLEHHANASVQPHAAGEFRSLRTNSEASTVPESQSSLAPKSQNTSKERSEKLPPPQPPAVGAESSCVTPELLMLLHLQRDSASSQLSLATDADARGSRSSAVESIALRLARAVRRINRRREVLQRMRQLLVVELAKRRLAQSVHDQSCGAGCIKLTPVLKEICASVNQTDEDFVSNTFAMLVVVGAIVQLTATVFLGGDNQGGRTLEHAMGPLFAYSRDIWFDLPASWSYTPRSMLAPFAALPFFVCFGFYLALLGLGNVKAHGTCWPGVVGLTTCAVQFGWSAWYGWWVVEHLRDHYQKQLASTQQEHTGLTILQTFERTFTDGDSDNWWKTVLVSVNVIISLALFVIQLQTEMRTIDAKLAKAASKTGKTVKTASRKTPSAAAQRASAAPRRGSLVAMIDGAMKHSMYQQLWADLKLWLLQTDEQGVHFPVALRAAIGASTVLTLIMTLWINLRFAKEYETYFASWTPAVSYMQQVLDDPHQGSWIKGLLSSDQIETLRYAVVLALMMQQNLVGALISGLRFGSVLGVCATLFGSVDTFFSYRDAYKFFATRGPSVMRFDISRSDTERFVPFFVIAQLFGFLLVVLFWSCLRVAWVLIFVEWPYAAVYRVTLASSWTIIVADTLVVRPFVIIYLQKINCGPALFVVQMWYLCMLGGNATAGCHHTLSSSHVIAPWRVRACLLSRCVRPQGCFSTLYCHPVCGAFVLQSRALPFSRRV
jgi:hypothetical protein